MNTESNFQKLYFQLAPSPAGREYLRDVTMSQEFDEAKLVNTERWHLTVIHLGDLRPVWQQLRASGFATTFKIFKNAMSNWASAVQQRTAGASYQLESTKLEFYGSNASVLALGFAPDEQLQADHNWAYELLVETWDDLGINQPEMMLRSLRETKFAHKLSPHVTLARGCDANIQLQQPQTSTIEFSPMKFFYQTHE